jgi:hypothetical protein
MNSPDPMPRSAGQSGFPRRASYTSLNLIEQFLKVMPDDYPLGTVWLRDYGLPWAAPGDLDVRALLAEFLQAQDGIGPGTLISGAQ